MNNRNTQSIINTLTDGKPGPNLGADHNVTPNMADMASDIEQASDMRERAEEAAERQQTREDRVERGERAVRADESSKV